MQTPPSSPINIEERIKRSNKRFTSKPTYEGVINRCLGCGIDMGEFNSRQYCEKNYCPFEYMNFSDNDSEIKLFSNIHQGHMNSAYKMFKSNIIFGHGPKLFRELCNNSEYKHEFSCSSHPHNTYIQLLAETGLVGFLFIFSFYCKLSIY